MQLPPPRFVLMPLAQDAGEVVARWHPEAVVLRAGRPGWTLLLEFLGQQGLPCLLLGTAGELRSATRLHPTCLQILALYDRLIMVWPSPLVALNRAVPLARVAGAAAALAEVESIERDRHVAAYPYLPAVKADLLARLGRREEAIAAYRDAAGRAGNAAEQALIAERIAG